MNSKDRVLRAINHQQTIGRNAITFDAQAEVYDLLYKYFGIADKNKIKLFDELHCDTLMLAPATLVFSPEEAIKPDIKKSIWQVEYKSTKTDTGAQYNEICGCPLAGKDDLSDLDNFKWPNVDDLDFSNFMERAKNSGDRAIIGVSCWGAYHTASFMRGMEDILLDFAMRRDYLDKLLGYISDYVLAANTKMLEEAGDCIDIVYMADDYCSQSGCLFSPDDFRTYCLPYVKNMVDLAHKYNKKFLLHVCGSVRPLLPILVDAGIDMLEPVQTRANGMNPIELKREFGKDICFYGGMDLQKTLISGTTEDVENEAKSLIETLGRDGGYIFGPGHTYIQIDAPLENILTMYKTALEYKI